MMKVHWILLSFIAFTGSQGVGAPARTANEVPDRYKFLQKLVLSDTELERVRAQLPFDRIESTESNPWGYRSQLGLSRDGSIVEQAGGLRRGTISIQDFGQLCYLIERIGFESMPGYAWNGYDATTCTVKVWRTGSQEPITVVDYGPIGPPDLWTLRTAIRGVESRASWK